MEGRLSVALKASAAPSVSAPVSAVALPDEASEAVGALATPVAMPEVGGSLFSEDAPWPTDESGEAAFLADAKQRGETVRPMAASAAAVNDEAENDTSPLPPLDDLVQRIPTAVRDTLEELYRAKFTAVRRVPAKNIGK